MRVFRVLAGSAAAGVMTVSLAAAPAQAAVVTVENRPSSYANVKLYYKTGCKDRTTSLPPGAKYRGSAKTIKASYKIIIDHNGSRHVHRKNKCVNLKAGFSAITVVTPSSET